MGGSGSAAAATPALPAAARAPTPAVSGEAVAAEDPAVDVSGGEDAKPNSIDKATDALTAMPTCGRNRQSVKSCPNTEHPPVAVIPSADSRVVVMDFLLASTKPLTDMRDAVSSMTTAVRGKSSIAKMRKTRPWWPTAPDGKTLWPQTVVVENKMLNAAAKVPVVDEGEKMVQVGRMMASRDAPAAQRVADMLLMVEKEPNSKDALVKFNLMLKPAALRRVVVLAPMAAAAVSDHPPTPSTHGSPAPATAAMLPPTAARPSLAAAAASGGTVAESTPRPGSGRPGPSRVPGARVAVEAFDNARVRAVLAAASAALVDGFTTGKGGAASASTQKRAASAARLPRSAPASAMARRPQAVEKPPLVVPQERSKAPASNGGLVLASAAAGGDASTPIPTSASRRPAGRSPVSHAAGSTMAGVSKRTPATGAATASETAASAVPASRPATSPRRPLLASPLSTAIAYDARPAQSQHTGSTPAVSSTSVQRPSTAEQAEVPRLRALLPKASRAATPVALTHAANSSSSVGLPKAMGRAEALTLLAPTASSNHSSPPVVVSASAGSSQVPGGAGGRGPPAISPLLPPPRRSSAAAPLAVVRPASASLPGPLPTTPHEKSSFEYPPAGNPKFGAVLPAVDAGAGSEPSAVAAHTQVVVSSAATTLMAAEAGVASTTAAVAQGVPEATAGGTASAAPGRRRASAAKPPIVPRPEKGAIVPRPTRPRTPATNPRREPPQSSAPRPRYSVHPSKVPAPKPPPKTVPRPLARKPTRPSRPSSASSAAATPEAQTKPSVAARHEAAVRPSLRQRAAAAQRASTPAARQTRASTAAPLPSSSRWVEMRQSRAAVKAPPTIPKVLIPGSSTTTAQQKRTGAGSSPPRPMWASTAPVSTERGATTRPSRPATPGGQHASPKQAPRSPQLASIAAAVAAMNSALALPSMGTASLERAGNDGVTAIKTTVKTAVNRKDSRTSHKRRRDRNSAEDPDGEEPPAKVLRRSPRKAGRTVQGG